MTLILDLQADQLALSDGDPVATWADQSGNGHDFTQSGTARPTFKTAGHNGFPAVFFDGVDDWLLGPNFADNLDNFTVIMVGDAGPDMVITKMNNTSNGAGWAFYSSGSIGIIQEAGGNNWIEKDINPLPSSFAWISTLQVVSKSEMHVYLSGDNSAEADFSDPPVNNYASVEPVRLNVFGNFNAFHEGYLNAVRIYSPALNDVGRETIEAELGGRYGLEGYPPESGTTMIESVPERGGYAVPTGTIGGSGRSRGRG